MTFPHCPNPGCVNFDAPKQENWFWQHGKTANKASGTIHRYRCKACRKTFSERTFSIDYYTQKKIDYDELMMQLVSCSGINDIGRKMKISPNMVNNRIERLAHSLLAIHSKILKKLPLLENFMADGLKSFAFSQYFPNHINIVVGAKSEFVYLCGFANLRRKGRMTAVQRKKRDRLEAIAKAHPKAIEYSMKTLFKSLMQLMDEKQVSQKRLDTNEHPAYRKAMKNIPGSKQYFSHHTALSTPSSNTTGSLFSVNYLDRQIRKDVSDHVRETIQFAKCPSAMMMRMVVYLHYHNCVIARRVKEQRRGNMETHAERAGITRKDLDSIIDQNFLRRAFLEKINLDKSSLKTWRREWRNPGIKMSPAREKIAV